jgi:glucose-6-phosphate 1-dehydrogenase
MKAHIKPKPTVFMIFGGTGDLAERKLIPALYNLFLAEYMPKEFIIVGLGRTAYQDASFRDVLLKGVNKHSRSGKAEKEKWDEFAKHISYLKADVHNEKDYERMEKIIEDCDANWSEPSVIIHYLAVTPQFFPIIAKNLAKMKMANDVNRTRIVVEKPFGHDLESAKELNHLLKDIFHESQIYRIDHYLGKETVQNMLAFRFANALFEPIWNRNYIEHVQISVTEDIGVEDRGGYYNTSGALRDMVQNHILQVLCLVAMEPPVNFDAEEIRNRKVDVLRAMRKFGSEEIRYNTVRGQYSEGWVEGEKVVGYREEKDVDPDSNTETFAALKFFIDNWRWQNVPFYVRTGKRIHQKSSIISIQFKDVPHLIFPSKSTESWQQNRLIISIQPEMSIRLQVQAKRPGLDMTLNPVDMVFNYDGTYSTDTPEAYETLLLDAMKGDQTLFMRGDQVETAWELLMPVLESWESKKSISFPNYSADSWGPETAEALIAKDGFHWFTLPIKKSEKEKK